MSQIAERVLHTRIARSVEAIRRSFEDNLFYVTGTTLESATTADHYTALACTIRDRMLARMVASNEIQSRAGAKTVAYLSAEYLPGPHLASNILNLKLQDAVREALDALGLDLHTILEAEEEPGLGNGGLGRLAACYMDSMATLEIPAIGYGLRYEYGIFDQTIRDGWQVEVADAWLKNGNPWELPRKERFPVRFGGHVERYYDDAGVQRARWVPKSTVFGQAYDTPILGHGVLNVNTLRLWKSEARESFDFQTFNTGDYYGAVESMVHAENICKVLYPNDEPAAGKALRLQQQYFFVSCSLQDMIRIALSEGAQLTSFARRFVVQLNDTHPAIAVAELMRLLVDEHLMPWNEAWGITQQTFAYTNHTLLPEALESWPVELFANILPRHLEIVYEINAVFLDEVRLHFISQPERVARLSLIDEGEMGGGRRVRMAHLACVGSHSINGVAAMHSDLLKRTVLRDFHDLWPNRFNNKTNGISPRRFIALANAPLAALLDEVVGRDWLRDLSQIRALTELADDAALQERWAAIKREAHEELAAYIADKCGVQVDPGSLFDMQVKRIHEYKRQHLNVLHVISRYQRLKDNPGASLMPRTFVFGGKAAPGYHMAKLIIKLINAVAEVVNRDPQVRDLMRVVFVPNFNVKTAQRIYPAADLSEQISTAGKEASGTGNMKFTLNGALTIGTLDGANVEIREAVGAENFFFFGKTVEEVDATWASGYEPYRIYEKNQTLRKAIDLLASGFFSHGDRALFQPLVDNLLHHDPFLVLADFDEYLQCQAQVDRTYADPVVWNRKSILNVARSGHFSSDRAVSEYNQTIWHADPVAGTVGESERPLRP